MPKYTLEKVQKDLKHFSYEIQMFIYHKLNGRDRDAQEYLDTYQEEQNAMLSELQIKGLEDTCKRNENVVLQILDTEKIIAK